MNTHKKSNQNQLSPPRRYARRLIHLFVMLLSFSVAVAALAQTQTSEESVEPRELHELSNAELLEQAQQTLGAASTTFLAQSRAMLRSDALVKEARQNANFIYIPPAEISFPAQDMTTLEQAQLTLEHLEKRLEALNGQTTALQEEKVLVEEYLKAIESAETAAKTLSKTIEGLEMTLLEIDLRVADKTLSAREIPQPLREKELQSQSKDVALQEENLTQQTVSAQHELERIAKRVETLQQFIVEAETDRFVAEETYKKESRRKNLDIGFLEERSESLVAQIPKLREERDWLNGSFNLANRRFTRSAAEANGLREQIESLRVPDAKKILELQTVTSAEEAEEATKTVEEMTQYYVQRIELLQQLEPVLNTIIQHGEVLESDASILENHLFTMEVLAEILEAYETVGIVKPESIPQSFRLDSLHDLTASVSEAFSTAFSAVEQAKTDVAAIPQDIEDAKVGQKDLHNKLTHLEESYKAALNAQKWEEGLLNLTAQEIVQNFEKDAQAIGAKMEELTQLRQTFAEANDVVKEAQQQFDAQQDPMLRTAQQESGKEKQQLQVSLYKFAEIELPEALTAPESQPSQEPNAQSSQTEQPEHAENAKEAQQAEVAPSPMEIIESYQNLVSSRARVLEARQERQAELLSALHTLEQQFDAYLSTLTETIALSQHYNASAVELKKRLGRKELQTDEVPDGIMDALKRETITALETESFDLLNRKTAVTQQIERLSQPDETQQEALTALTDILGFVGTRLDVLRDVQKLHQDFERQWTDLSDVEQTTLEQTAIRRTENDDSVIEQVLAFVPSDRAQGLTELLHNYYAELLEVEHKRDNLEEQTQQFERLIELANDERAKVEILLPFLRQQTEELQHRQELELTKIQMQLQPQQAEDILNQYKSKTGQSIPIPSPIAEKDRPVAIEAGAVLLFDYHVQTVAVKKWLTLFERRLSEVGIPREAGVYQDELGAVQARISSVQRQIYYLAGYPPEEIQKIPQDAQPDNDDDALRLSGGEIGVLRNDRQNLRRQEMNWIGGKVAIILVIAIFMHWITNVFMKRMIRRSQEVREGDNMEKRAQTAVLLSLLSTVINIVIWVFAIVATLSTLGIQVGAILAGLGIGGLAVAMALQGTLSNMFAGMYILFAKSSFNLGDWVQVGDVEEGQVVDITWRVTRIKTRLGHVLTVPNSAVTDSVVVNYHYPDDTPRLEFRLETAPVYDPEYVQKILYDAALSVPEVVSDPAPYIVFHGQGDSSAIFTVQFSFHDYGRHDQCISNVWMRVWKHLEHAGIELATPRRELMRAPGIPPEDLTHHTALTVLQASDVFGDLPDESLSALAEKLRVQYAKSDETIVKRGEPGNSLYLILEGAVSIRGGQGAGESAETTRLGANKIFGAHAVLSDSPREADIAALTETIMYEVTRDDLAPLLEQHPNLAERLKLIVH